MLRILNSPELLSIFPFHSGNVDLTYLGALMLGKYVFIFVISLQIGTFV